MAVAYVHFNCTCFLKGHSMSNVRSWYVLLDFQYNTLTKSTALASDLTKNIEWPATFELSGN